MEEARPCKKLRGPRGGEALSGWSWAEEGATAFGPSEAKGWTAVRDGSGGSSDSTVKQDELRVPLLQPRPAPVLFGLVKLYEVRKKSEIGNGQKYFDRVFIQFVIKTHSNIKQ